MDDWLNTGDRFDGAIVAAVNAHRDEIHQLRLALSVLALVPDALDDDPEFRFKQTEAIRIAKLYADDALFKHQSVEDVIAVLQEGLA